MFVGDEQLLDTSFTTARNRLADLTGDDFLTAASEAAFCGEITRLGEAALAVVPGVSALAQVHVRPLTTRDGSARLAVRWEVIGPDGGLFPVLDADLTLAAAGQHSTRLTVAATYRSPGTVGTSRDGATWQMLAAATIRAFLERVAVAIDNSAGGA
jgi:hypothetical protein